MGRKYKHMTETEFNQLKKLLELKLDAEAINQVTKTKRSPWTYTMIRNSESFEDYKTNTRVYIAKYSQKGKEKKTPMITTTSPEVRPYQGKWITFYLRNGQVTIENVIKAKSISGTIYVTTAEGTTFSAHNVPYMTNLVYPQDYDFASPVSYDDRQDPIRANGLRSYSAD